MSGCDSAAWVGYSYHPYQQTQHLHQQRFNPSIAQYCGGQHYLQPSLQQAHYGGSNVDTIPPPEACPPHYWDGDELIDAFGRVVKRRSSANKKERRRTQSINTAFAELRDCIPNVPADTKLSKIKTLRLATSYIAYLMKVLKTEDAAVQTFAEYKADLPQKSKLILSCLQKDQIDLEIESSRRLEVPTFVPNRCGHNNDVNICSEITMKPSLTHAHFAKTGWPQTVWAKELTF